MPTKLHLRSRCLHGKKGGPAVRGVVKVAVTTVIRVLLLVLL